MVSSTLRALKAASITKSAEERQELARQRDAMVLIIGHLQQMGLMDTASVLIKEAPYLAHYEVADNIDMLTLLSVYVEYYESKFRKRPTFSRKKTEDDRDNLTLSKNDRHLEAAKRRLAQKYGVESDLQSMTSLAHVNNQTIKAKQMAPSIGNDKRGSCSSTEHNKEISEDNNSNTIQGIQGKALGIKLNETESSQFDGAEYEKEIKKAMTNPYPRDSELRSMADSLSNEIVQKSLDVKWSDIVELDDAKKLLQEAVILPIKYPQLFCGLLRPWRGVLLYGPPGTGKTLLAKAVASESKTTFFNISASSIVSKYRGDSEKMIRVLFDLARHHSPSTIFIDEIDSIMNSRGSGEQGAEHEGTRRMKTEFLVQMDGLGTKSELIFILAASNLPWDLESALLRRLEKRIYVPLPNQKARQKLMESFLGDQHSFPLESGFNFEKFAGLTSGYSGADIHSLCKEVAMMALRRILNSLETMVHEKAPRKSITENTNDFVSSLRKEYPILVSDMVKALENTKPSTDKSLCERYIKWTSDFGAT